MLLLLALFCRCGGAGALPGGFAEIPFDTKSRLINYRTEGQGENTVRADPFIQMCLLMTGRLKGTCVQEVPLVNLPLQTDVDLLDMGMVNRTAAAGQMEVMDLHQRSFASMDGMNGGLGYGAGQMEGSWRGMSQAGGSVFNSEFMSRQADTGIFDGMALPHHYLGQYYSQVSLSFYTCFIYLTMQDLT